MAEIWHGTHRPSGESVAFKIMKPLDERPQARAFFRGLFGQEVRAVARLDHPGIVRVYDYGTLPEPLGGLPANSPYAVLEWVEGGVLRDVQGQLPWPQVQANLLGLLAALGHAHARLVLHRDLKPGNVLLCDRGPVLTDFGVAVDMETGGLSNAAVMGTPAYMAPEQVLAQWHRQGPWTDLYAVGCLGWSMVTGKSPFARANADDVFQAQVRDALPDFEPKVPVPAGFEAWLRRMLAKPIEARFGFAAQAAQALAAIDGVVELPLVGDWAAPDESESTLIDGQPPEMTAGPRGASPEPLEPEPTPACTLPTDWRGAQPNPAPALSEVGASLVGIRDLGLVGRETERDLAWSALRQVADGDGPRLLLVEAPEGRGKRSFARWLGRRAHELGVARRMRITHAAQPTPRCGLAAAFARTLHCDGLDATDRVIRIADVLGASPLDEGPQALSAALDLREGGDGGLQLDSDRESHVAFLDGLRLLAGDGVAVITLTELQWSAESVEFLEHALASPEREPVLFVGLIGEAGRSAAEAGLVRLREHPRTLHVTLEGLTNEGVQAIVRAMVSDARAAESISARVDGDARAAQAEAKALLRRGRITSRAVDVAATWAAQLDDVLPPDDPASPAYELAAMLGNEVDDGLWRAAAERAGWPVDGEAHERLSNAALILDDEAGTWRFVMPSVREALSARAHHTERWRPAQHALALELDARPDVPAEQAAACFAAAGQVDLALDRYDAALRYRLDRGAWDAAAEICLAQAQVLRRARRGPPEPRWVDVRQRWSRIAGARGRTAAAVRWADRAVALARQLDTPRRLIEALLGLGDAVAQRHGITEAWAHYWEASRLCRGEASGALTLRVLTKAGWAQSRMGHVDEAAAMLERGLGLAEPDTRGRADVYRALAMVAWQRGVPAEARAHAAAAVAIYDALGLRGPKAEALAILADAARHQGDLAAAEQAQREVVALASRVGSEQRYAAEGNLGLCLVAAGRDAEAHPLLVASVGQAQRDGRGDVAAVMGLHLALLEARRGDWMPSVGVLSPPSALTDGSVASADAALGALALARFAEGSGQASIADAAWAVAQDQFSRLGRAEEYGDVAVEAALARAGRAGEALEI